METSRRPGDDLAADLTPPVVRRALGGDRAAVTALVDHLTPVVQARVARVLLRCAPTASGRDIQQEVEDLTQEAFLALFDDDGRILRAWDPARGLSLRNFAGLVAERQTLNALASKRRNPWTDVPTPDEHLAPAEADRLDPEVRAGSRELLQRVADRLRAELSPTGLHIFEALLVRSRSVPEVMAETGLSRDALYVWRCRLRKHVRRLVYELAAGSDLVPARRVRRSGR